MIQNCFTKQKTLLLMFSCRMQYFNLLLPVFSVIRLSGADDFNPLSIKQNFTVCVKARRHFFSISMKVGIRGFSGSLLTNFHYKIGNKNGGCNMVDQKSINLLD